MTSGTAYPYDEAQFSAVPLGHDCQSADPYGPNGTPNPRYCSVPIFEVGVPATGSGSLVSGGVTVGGPIGLPQSAFVAPGITGFLPTYYPYLQSWTYATFAARAGSFFTGGGPAAGGTNVKSGMGQTSGDWVVRPGTNAFGGVMGTLGRYGAVVQYKVTAKADTYEGTGSWVMVPPLGRERYATPIATTGMGKTTAWQNPDQNTNVYTNNLNGNTSGLAIRGTATGWTTGTVAVYAQAGVFQTILQRTGFDTATGTGTDRVRNIQLVTPLLSHWIGPGFQTHTGQIGILKLTITPEPEAMLLLAAGAGLLALLYRVQRRA